MKHFIKNALGTHGIIPLIFVFLLALSVALYGDFIPVFSLKFPSLELTAVQETIKEKIRGVYPAEPLQEGLGNPTFLVIPALGVRASVEKVGLTPQNAMANPSSFKTVAWFRLGIEPGATGSAVIAGHLDNALDARGVFENLNNAKKGDEIFIENVDGRRARFIVSNSASYDLGSAPLQKIFATDGPPRLNLITCDGAWDNNKKNYSKRLVVSADFVGLVSGN